MTHRNELDRLLSKGRLSGPRRDRILEEVIGKVRPTQTIRSSRYLMVAGPLALAAALALVLRPSSKTSDGYHAKGARASHIVDVGCSEGALSACPRGSKLIFRFDGIVAPTFVQAYAEPVRPGGERVWYFPTKTSPAPVIDPGPGVRPLDKGIVLGPEHAIGGYRIHILLSESPLSREDVLGVDPSTVEDARIIDLEVIE